MKFCLSFLSLKKLFGNRRWLCVRSLVSVDFRRPSMTYEILIDVWKLILWNYPLWDVTSKMWKYIKVVSRVAHNEYFVCFDPVISCNKILVERRDVIYLFYLKGLSSAEWDKSVGFSQKIYLVRWRYISECCLSTSVKLKCIS